MKLTQASAKHQKGFTLIELSIVLVIIGLIVGGVLVGQDLIKAAEIRATISQYEKYNTALNTFRSKFNGLPGDLAQTQATAFGLYASTAALTGQGDANGVIEGGATGDASPEGETLIFWRHLSEANLVDGSYGTVGNSALTVDGVVTADVTDVSQSLPAAKLGPAGYFVVYSISGLNFYNIIPVTGVANAGTYAAGTSGMTPIQLSNIDLKLDDGSPSNGIVIATSLDATGLNGVPAFGAGGAMRPTMGSSSSTTVCTVGANYAQATYNRDAGNGGTATNCGARLRFN